MTVEDYRFLRFEWEGRTVNLNYGADWPPPEVLWVMPVDDQFLVSAEQVTSEQVPMARQEFSKIGLREDGTPDPDYVPSPHIGRGARYEVTP